MFQGENMKPLTSLAVDEVQTRGIQLWHAKEKLIHSWDEALRLLPPSHDGLFRLIYENQLINCYQWHEEDKARIPHAPDSFLAQVKREIDASNQRRTDKIEEIDGYLVNWLADKLGQLDEDIPMNSETPGNIIDRLSILSLKIYHMRQETRRRDAPADNALRCRKKLEILWEQKKDLHQCLDQLIEDLIQGRKRLKVYYQLKMYNDPQTNPAIYLNLKQGSH
jgi:hypothetical protein